MKSASSKVRSYYKEQAGAESLTRCLGSSPQFLCVLNWCCSVVSIVLYSLPEEKKAHMYTVV